MHSIKKNFVYIFDLDGVLIEPVGYRCAFEDTLGYFLEPGGLMKWVPSHQIHPVFESLGVTNEWDMVAILLAVVIEQAISRMPPGKMFTTINEFVEWSTRNPMDLSDFDVFQKIRSFEPVFHQDGLPSQVLLDVSRSGADLYFPMLGKHPLLGILLEDTWNIETCTTTAVYQNYSLGSEDFKKNYGFAGLILTPSYLDLYDHVNISSESTRRLLEFRKEKVIHPGILTLRSSLPPDGIHTIGSMYSPEAEKARKLIGLDGIPLMGFGRVYYLSQASGLPISQLIKPAMPQALAAILAALSGDEAWSVGTVGEICLKGVIDTFLLDRIKELVGDECSIFVFEDSRVGIQSCINACQWLGRNCQTEIIFKAWGISSHLDKIDALTQYGAAIFPDINAALDDSYSNLPHDSQSAGLGHMPA